MCGIIGYVGDRPALPILIEGLKRMEYRGYDSAGVALLEDGRMKVVKRAGKIRELELKLSGMSLSGTVGIGHTRWATHGEPNETNAHPHWDCGGEIAVIHNGIIENYVSLKEELVKKGHSLRTETDTEILAHLIEEFYEGDLEQAVRYALQEVEGTYGIAVLCRKEPDRILAARMGSPLIVGRGKGENFVASDAAAVIGHTRNVTYLDDGEMVTITRGEAIHKTLANERIPKKVEEIGFDIEQIEKGGYSHFMLKEIFEQPRTVADAMRGRLLEEEGIARLGGVRDYIQRLSQARKIFITACGTSWHAGLIGEYMLEEYARIPVEVEYASEFRYRNPVIRDNTFVIAISQSGETIDTLAAVREGKRKGATTLGICNVVGSTIARETDGGVYIHAGPEIGVASTKAFTAQVTALALLTMALARQAEMGSSTGRFIINALKSLPSQVEKVLRTDDQILEIASEFKDMKNFLYLGRGYNFPVALEGALKLKEISYIHAEGYPAAEMKHGPIALIDENMPVVFIATQDGTYDKVMSNIEEVRARRGRVIAIANEGDVEIRKKAEHVIYIPKTLNLLMPILAVIPLQLLAYHIAVLKELDVDQPRNLAKSVTVE
ncbi:glutamine--fructose-6-phosphate transaminase (isomerizing) [candidate division KSB1 bacterium]|nr:glutamine--fructose-6-phosphate transaminase (isomerizing) [candidate division KSB1 bacterium]